MRKRKKGSRMDRPKDEKEALEFGELLNSATSTSRKSLLELSRQIYDQIVYCRKLM